jgi:hypothetical protein
MLAISWIGSKTMPRLIEVLMRLEKFTLLMKWNFHTLYYAIRVQEKQFASQSESYPLRNVPLEDFVGKLFPMFEMGINSKPSGLSLTVMSLISQEIVHKFVNSLTISRDLESVMEELQSRIVGSMKKGPFLPGPTSTYWSEVIYKEKI